MDRDVLTPDFLNALSSKTILWKVNSDSDEGKALRETWKVRGLPTVILIDTTGKEVDRILGYEGREEFVRNYLAYLYGVGTLPDLLARAGEAPEAEASLAITEKYAGRQDTPNTLAWVAKTRAAKGEKPEGMEYKLQGLEGYALLATEPEKGVVILKKLVTDPKAGEAGDDAFDALRRLYKKAKKNGELLALFELALPVKADSADFLELYAWTLAGQGAQLEKALEFAQKAVALSKDSPDKMGTLAEVYFKMGKKEQALAAVNKAIAGKPDDEDFQSQKKRYLGEEAGK